MPAFGVTIRDFERLRGIGCVMVDTTCGSVLNVWKRVESYARDGFTAVIHGKYYHEETKATASQVMKYPGGPLPRGAQHGRGAGGAATTSSRAGTRRRCRAASRRRHSPGLRLHPRPRAGGHREPDHDARRASRSRSRRSSGAAWSGATARRPSREHFRTFDTICSATQERQDAVVTLLAGAARPDGGGGRVQLEQHDPPRRPGRVARACGPITSRMPTAWIREAGTIRHQPVGQKQEVEAAGWLGASRRIGITAGASTPNNKVGETIARIAATAGLERELGVLLESQRPR